MLTFEMFRTIHRSEPGLTINKAVALKDIVVFLGDETMIIEAEEDLFVSHDHHAYLRAHWVSLDGKEHWLGVINDSAVTIRKNK